MRNTALSSSVRAGLFLTTPPLLAAAASAISRAANELLETISPLGRFSRLDFSPELGAAWGNEKP